MIMSCPTAHAAFLCSQIFVTACVPFSFLPRRSSVGDQWRHVWVGGEAPGGSPNAGVRCIDARVGVSSPTITSLCSPAVESLHPILSLWRHRLPSSAHRRPRRRRSTRRAAPKRSQRRPPTPPPRPMSLLSPAESLAFNGFLSSVDYGDVLDSEWAAIASQLAPPKGKEALAKATKDLMSLEPQLEDSPPTTSTSVRPALGSHSDSPSPPPPASPSSPSTTTDSALSSSTDKMQTITATAAASGASSMNPWASFASPSDPSSHHHHQQHRYTYGFGIPSHTPSPIQRSSTSTIYANPFEPALHGLGPLGHPSSLPSPYPHAHSESSLRHRPASLHSQSPTSATHGHGHGFILPPLPDHAHQQLHSHQLSQSPIYSHPDPLLQQHQHRLQHPGISTSNSAPSVLLQRTSSSKRSLPPDGDSDTSSSTANHNMKRQRRPSTTPSLDSTSPETPSAMQPPSSSGGGQRQALLSPSQKRANHIQSEQKRRANIRRGYEALCEVVPSLREAIKAEEESLAAAGESLAVIFPSFALWVLNSVVPSAFLRVCIPSVPCALCAKLRFTHDVSHWGCVVTSFSSLWAPALGPCPFIPPSPPIRV